MNTENDKMDKRDWTEDLPGLMEGYAEPEPEGLWEAVRAEVGIRRKAAARRGWWYAGGALAAAAAVALFVVFKPFRTPSPVPASPDRTLADASARQESVPAVPDREVELPESPMETVPAERTHAGASGPRAPSQPKLLAQAQPVPEAHTGPENPFEPESRTEPKPQPEPETQPDRESSPETSVESPLPAQEQPVSRQPVPSRPVRSREPVRVQLGVSATGLLAQAGPQTVVGLTPLAAVPYTRSISSGNNYTDLTMAGRNKPGTTEVSHRQSARFGVGIKVHFLPHWGIETGLVNTRLQSSFDTRSGQSTLLTQREYAYWGVPLYLHYDLAGRGPFSVYLAAGPMAEWCRGYKETNSLYFNGNQLTTQNGFQDIWDWRWSLNAGAGVQWDFFDHNALFVQPGLSWHLPASGTPDNYYSARPLAFQFTVGYRLILF